MNLYQPWVKWAFLQGASGSASRLMQKVIGKVSENLPHTVYSTLIIGVIQALGGLLIARARKTPLGLRGRLLAGSVCFGILAVVNTVLSFMTFVPRNGVVADVGVATLIVTLSIVPGAFIDILIFRRHLNVVQWLGVVLSIIAGWAVLNAPSLEQVKHLPLWVWIALANAFFVAVNQGLSQWIWDIDPWLKNLWVGVTTIVVSAVAFLLLSSPGEIAGYRLVVKLSATSVLIGLAVIALIACNVMAFRNKAQITEKKVVFNGSWLILTMLGGVAFFGEALTGWKIAGIALFLVGYWLTQIKKL